MEILPYHIRRVRHPYYEQQKSSHPDCEAARSGWHPYAHQAALLDQWHQHDSFVLTTKTGSGKTQAAALPIIANRESAFFIYPTNALIEDQQRSIVQLIQGLGLRPYIYHAGSGFDRIAFNQADVLVLRLDADSLEQMRRQSHLRTKGSVLVDVLNLGMPTIVLTNPDTLFLILALRYAERMAVFATLSQYRTLVVDEFHLYGGVELAHLLFMLHYCRANGFFAGRTVLLTATPDDQVSELLNALLAPCCVSADVATVRPAVDDRLVAHAVELVPIPPGAEPVHTALEQFERLRPELENLLASSKDEDHVPIVIILNSVMAAMYAADLLRDQYHVDPNQVGEYRGLMDPRQRSFKGKLVVVGTSAIEVGIDFKCRYLIFEAGDAASFMQRFGRVGRHEEGTAYLLAPPNVLAASQAITRPLSRDELETRARLWYEQHDARAWFARSESGLVTAALLGQRLAQEITADRSATPTIIEEAQRKVRAALAEYASRIGALDAYSQVAKKLDLYARNRAAVPWAWIRAYEARMAFRTSSTSISVHDIREEQRPAADGTERSGWYPADLRTLLQRGKNAKPGRDKYGQDYVTVFGYTRARRVEADVKVGSLGQLYTTHQMRDNYNRGVILTCDGRTSLLSDKMMQDDHVFVVVPDSVRDAVDWRIAAFAHAQGLLAFDGDALLLKEIYERSRQPRGQEDLRTAI